MYGSGVKPLKGGGIRWIDHKLEAVGRLLEKFGLYVGHLKDSTSSAKNTAASATLQGKLKKLVDAKGLPRSTFFTDVLAEAKKFGLLTQEKNVNVTMKNAVESTKSNYELLMKKIQDSNDYILTLPNFKIIIDVIESNEDEDGESLYQGHKLVNYSREKHVLLDHAQYIVKKIIDCFEQRYGNLFGKKANVNINSDEGGRVLFDVA